MKDPDKNKNKGLEAKANQAGKEVADERRAYLQPWKYIQFEMIYNSIIHRSVWYPITCRN